jgi:hypothetical protein
MRAMKKALSTPQYRNLVTWLKEVRLDSNLSMRDLGDRMKRPHTYVQKVETTERILDVHEYVIYCEALGLDPREGLNYLISRHQS